MNVADLSLYEKDANGDERKDAKGKRIPGRDNDGQEIERIFAKKAPMYAVYRADDRVKVHFADTGVKSGAADGAQLSEKQRKDLSQLAPLRGEIDGLIDGWKIRPAANGTARDNPKLRDKAHRYHRRLGDALIVAMEEDLTGARDVLVKIKEDILGERIAFARFEYLIAAFATALALMFLSWLLGSIMPTAPGGSESDLGYRMAIVGVVSILLLAMAAGLIARFDAMTPAWRAGVIAAIVAVPIVTMLLIAPVEPRRIDPDYRLGVSAWRASAAGAMGAFFSIALAIRGRTVLPDLLRRSNLMDAVLRVTIGYIAAAVLISLIEGRVVNFTFGGQSVSGGGLLLVLFAGFIAGFSERFVPDLLEKASAKPGDTPVVLGNDREKIAAKIKDIAGKPDAGKPGAEAEADEIDLPPGQANEDCCASDIELQDDEVTDDVDLPPASGGVAQPVQEKAA